MFDWAALPAELRLHITTRFLHGEYTSGRLCKMEWMLSKAWQRLRPRLRARARAAIEYAEYQRLSGRQTEARVIGRCAMCAVWLTNVHERKGECQQINTLTLNSQSRAIAQANSGAFWRRLADRGSVWACHNCYDLCMGCGTPRVIMDLNSFGLCFQCNHRHDPPQYALERHFARTSSVDGKPCTWFGCKGVRCVCRDCPRGLCLRMGCLCAHALAERRKKRRLLRL